MLFTLTVSGFNAMTDQCILPVKRDTFQNIVSLNAIVDLIFKTIIPLFQFISIKCCNLKEMLEFNLKVTKSCIAKTLLNYTHQPSDSPFLCINTALTIAGISDTAPPSGLIK